MDFEDQLIYELLTFQAKSIINGMETQLLNCPVAWWISLCKHYGTHALSNSQIYSLKKTINILCQRKQGSKLQWLGWICCQEEVE